MKKHVMAITYEPKKDDVFSGLCRQTIRKCDKVNEGDEILFHDWVGLPYRSKWLQRKRITVRKVYNVMITKSGIRIMYTTAVYAWTNICADKLAQKDYIEPPTGIELKNVLFKLNGNKAPKKAEQYQIIRW